MLPGAAHDAQAIGALFWDFESVDQIYEDAAYTSYLFEDVALEAGVEILTQRKSEAKRKYEPYVAYLKNSYRKQIETAFSGITDLFPKAMHCVSTKGFFIKALLFLMAYQVNKII